MNMQVPTLEEEAKEVELLVESLYKPGLNTKISEINSVLTRIFEDAEKINLMKFLLYYSNSLYTKMYASNAIFLIVTNNFLSVDWKYKLEIYEFLLNFLKNSSHELLVKSKFLFNTMVKLLCRLCRLSWFQNERFKTIVEDVANCLTYEAALTNFLIFNELIYEFQLTNIPPKNKYLRLISEFKETVLLNIYEYSTKYFLDIFMKELKFDKIDQLLVFIIEIAKCLISSFEFDENNLYDKSDKYFIDVSYVPNKNRRQRDKVLDIGQLALICKNLFDYYIISSDKGDEESHILLTLLQKYVTIKVFYFGNDENKAEFFTYIKTGISELISRKQGLSKQKNLEEFCRLIFCLKKNFTPLEIIENDKFVSTVFDFSNECIDFYPESINGLTFLIKFWTLFSTTIVINNNFPFKDKYKHITKSIFERICQKLIESVNTVNINDINDKVSESLLNDLLLSMAVLSKGMFFESLEIVNNYLDSIYNSFNFYLNSKEITLNKDLLLKLNYLLLLSTELITFNQKLLLEPTFVEKILDEREQEDLKIGIDNIDNEIESLSVIISKVFKILQIYIYQIKCQELLLLQNGIFSFLTNFSKIFLTSKLCIKYVNVFTRVSSFLSFSENSEILSIIISFIVDIFQISDPNDKDQFILLHRIIKIFKKIIGNIRLHEVQDSGELHLFLGKLPLTKAIIDKILSIHQKIFTLDPIRYGKLRCIFFSSITRILLIKKEKNGHYEKLVLFYKDNIEIFNKIENKTEQNNITMLGILKDLKGIANSIKSIDDFLIFIEPISCVFSMILDFLVAHINLREVTYSILTFMEILSDNSVNKIQSRSNSTFPDDIFKTSCEILKSYSSYYNQIKGSIDKVYLSQIKPICKLLKIFVNIFSGNYINVLTYYKINKQMVIDIFKTLTELIFSIRLEDIMSHLKKTKVVFQILKIFYNDFLPQYLSIHYNAFDFIIKVIEEGTESLESTSLILSYDFLSVLIKIFFKHKRNISTTPSEEAVAIKQIFEKYQDVFNRILNNIIKHLLNGENLNNYVAETLFGLMKMYDTYYINLVNSILFKFNSEDLSKDKFFGLKNSFEKLSAGLPETHDHKSINAFSKKLSEFYIEINNLT